MNFAKIFNVWSIVGTLAVLAVFTGSYALTYQAGVDRGRMEVELAVEKATRDLERQAAQDRLELQIKTQLQLRQQREKEKELEAQIDALSTTENNASNCVDLGADWMSDINSIR